MLESYLTIIIIILILSQVVLVMAYFPLFKLMRRLKNKDQHQEDQAINEAENILEEARQAAKQQISESADFAADLKDKYRDSLEKLSKELLADYQRDFLDWGNQSKDSLKNISNRLDESASQILAGFQTELAEQSKQAISHVQEGVISEVTSVQGEINDYKKAYIKKLADNAKDIVRETVKESLARNLTPSDHQALVEAALGKIEFENGKHNP